MVTRRQVTAGVGLAGVAGLAVILSPELVVSWARRAMYSAWFPVILVGLYLLRPAVAWPITILSALVGFRYGVVVGLPLALGGTVLTSLPPYLLARRMHPADGPFAWASLGSQRFFAAVGDFRGLVAARLAPTPAEATSTAAGVAGLSLPVFVLGTLAGELPWTIAAVLAGSSLSRFDPTAVAPDPRLVVALLVIVVLLLAGPTYRYFTRAAAER